MWYIFDTNFTLQGVMDEIFNIEINHFFYECDTISFSVPYTDDNYLTLQLGGILYRSDTQKAYRIHTVEINESQKSILGNGYGLESILDQRIVSSPAAFSGKKPSFIMESLVDKNLISATDSNRRLPNLSINTLSATQSTMDATYYGETLYSIISELSKSNELGYRFNYDPIAKTIVFEAFLGVDRTINQSAVDPIRWSSRWGDTRDENFLLSNKSYKNFVYLTSADQTNPITTSVGSGSGWSRFESFSNATDINQQLKDDAGNVLTAAQVTNLLKSRGNLELFRNYLISDYSFTLNTDIPQIFQKDYNVGDIISVTNENYGIIKHSRIISVNEKIIQNRSQFEIKFED
jgi:hypothetical protein